MYDWFLRWKYRFMVVMGYADCLKRRTAVENYLWQAAAGNKPLPNAEKCRELAKTLGIPSKVKQ